MIDFDDFLPLIEPNAAAAPEPVMTRCLRRAAIRFCERTRLWRASDTITTDGLNPEAISLPTDSVLFEIADCSIDGRPLDPTSIGDLAKERPGWRTEDVGCGGARWYISPEFGTVQAVPRSSGTISVDCVVKPSMRAQTLPDFLFDLYGEDIAGAAAGYVLTTPDAAFANPQLGSALIQIFEARLVTLSDMGRRGQQKARARSRAKFF